MTTFQSGPLRAADDPRSLRRLEDERFLTGRGRYVEDLRVGTELIGAFLRSPHAHATIAAIQVPDEAVPGVHGIFTGADILADGVGPLHCPVNLRDGTTVIVPPRPPLARDRVRHVGEAVAFVVAESLAAAEAAMDRIGVEYEPLPAIVDPAQAVAAEAAQIWPQAPGNMSFRYVRGDAERTKAAFDGAAHVVSLDLVNNRVAAVALEPRTALAEWDGGSGRYRLFCSAGSVHRIRNELAVQFGLAPERLDVIAPDVGGGFGMKNVVFPEYAVLLWAARRLRRPVRWTAARIEDFTSGGHGRGSLTTARLALDSDCRILGLDVQTIADLGAYISPGGPVSATVAPATALGGLYDVPAIRFDVRGVFTNTGPVEAYRGAGKPEANYIVERLLDVAARRCGIDPVELRGRNLISRFPFRTALGQTIDCGAFQDGLRRAVAQADVAGFSGRRRQAAARGRLRGLGVACFLETSRGQPDEEAWLRFAGDGLIEVAVGTQSNGQGHETTFVQLVAGRLDLPLERFRFVQGDTRQVPRGGGHGGARSLHQGGTALLLASADLLERATEAAAEALQTDLANVTYARGEFSRTDGALQATITLSELAGQARASNLAGTLDGHGDNRCDVFTFPSGSHVAEVEIDPHTGEITLISYVAVDDFGTLLNPLMTEGQVQGGIVQGIGQALCEGIRYDGESGQLLTASLMDYALPRSQDIPDIDVHFMEVPTGANPLGAKGAGQAGAIAAPPTIVNAVVDALSSFGIEHLDMPLTPARVWAAIRASQARGPVIPPARPTPPTR